MTEKGGDVGLCVSADATYAKGFKVLYSRVLTQGDSAPRGHLAMSRDNCGYTGPGRLLSALQCPGRPHRGSSGPDVSSDEGQGPAVKMNNQSY